ncbi:MAG: hypothetical protein ACE5LX_00900 [Nitrospinota bacterium]
MAEPEKIPEEIGRLSDAIIKAILSSEEVKGILSLLQQQGLVAPDDIFALALKFPTAGVMEAKMGQIRVEGKEGEDAVPVSPPLPSKEKAQFVDGKKLSPAEEAFMEYCAERFDSAEWLKKARIRFPD